MTNEKKRLVPELRFRGFTDDWEQRKLGDISKISTGKLDANAMVENGRYDFYTSGIKKYKIDVPAFEGPAITIAGNGATVGYMHLADNQFNAYQRTYVLQNFVVNRGFLFSEIGNKLPQKIHQEARTGNIPYIVMDMLTDLKLAIPKDESEQSKIGSFFKQLDNTIDLHHRKHEALLKLKEAYLQNLFPEKDNKYPVLRFAGFTDDWEQRKLGSLVHIQSGYAPMEMLISNNPDDPMYIKVDDLNYSSRIQARASLHVQERDSFAKAAKGATIFAKRGAAILTNKVRILGADAYMDTNMMALEPKAIDGDFLYSMISRVGLYKIADTSTIPQINNKHIIPYKVNLPGHDEQTQIAHVLELLDSTIALHQRKLEKLQELKKGYLQKMFY